MSKYRSPSLIDRKGRFKTLRSINLSYSDTFLWDWIWIWLDDDNGLWS